MDVCTTRLAHSHSPITPSLHLYWYFITWKWALLSLSLYLSCIWRLNQVSCVKASLWGGLETRLAGSEKSNGKFLHHVIIIPHVIQYMILKSYKHHAWDHQITQIVELFCCVKVGRLHVTDQCRRGLFTWLTNIEKFNLFSANTQASSIMSGSTGCLWTKTVSCQIHENAALNEVPSHAILHGYEDRNALINVVIADYCLINFLSIAGRLTRANVYYSCVSLSKSCMH